MAMDHSDPFSDQDNPHNGKCAVDGGESGLGVEGQPRNVVHFQTAGHVSDACPVPIRMGQNHNLKKGTE
jgi:hypothetical protein